jgi:hypothetical protein
MDISRKVEMLLCQTTRYHRHRYCSEKGSLSRSCRHSGGVVDSSTHAQASGELEGFGRNRSWTANGRKQSVLQPRFEPNPYNYGNPLSILLQTWEFYSASYATTVDILRSPL